MSKLRTDVRPDQADGCIELTPATPKQARDWEDRLLRCGVPVMANVNTPCKGRGRKPVAGYWPTLMVKATREQAAEALKETR